MINRADYESLLIDSINAVFYTTACNHVDMNEFLRTVHRITALILKFVRLRMSSNLKEERKTGSKIAKHTDQFLGS